MAKKPINVDEVLERYGEAKTRKSRTDSERREAGKYAWPAAQEQVRNALSNDDIINTIEKYDDTAVRSAYRMTSGIFTYLMPAGSFWHGFKAQDYELNQQPEYQKWMSIAATQTHAELMRSNFQREMFLTIRSMIVFGTGVISVEMIDGDIIFKSHHIGFMFFDDNSRGEIDTVYRQIFYTVRQAAQAFGIKNLSKSAAKAFKAGKFSEKHEYVHVCAPNKDFDGRMGSGKVKSFFICIPDKEIVKEDPDFKHLPYLVARFARTPGGLMGFGPAMEYIDDIRMLNRMVASFIESAELANNPPMMMEDDGVVGQPVTGPHGTIYVRTGAQFPQPYVSGINVQSNGEVIRQMREIIRMAFFNDLFEAMGEHRNMSATEAVIREKELIVIATPAVVSLENEIFSPMLTRVLDLLVKSPRKGNRIPQPPASFDYDVTYHGRLSLAMANVQSNAQEVVLAKYAPYQEFVPILENVDMDRTFRTAWISGGAPAENLVDFDEMIAARQEKQQLELAAAQAQIGESASKAYKNVSGVPEAGSLAETVI
ncbi:hypothetical protein LCGC14_0659800 [marine sediment metagenome]|uniref:Bacteriophage head to tail connecting protein n=1 Tax=marine sediment metagenome TaxID=412755 RepID=A0A0F9TFC9_9ZZZZ